MIRTKRQGYEAVRILCKDGLPYSEVYTFQEQTPDHGIIVRNLFSLTGTRHEETLLASLPQALDLPLHPGYVSVGRVEHVGKYCQHFSEGDEILLSAQYGTYVAYDHVQPSSTSVELLRKITCTSDPLHNLFIPLVSLAIYLVEQIQDSQREGIIFVGCGLLGAVLLQVLPLKLGEVNISVYRDGTDLKEEWLRGHGVDKVITIPHALPTQNAKESIVYIFTSSLWGNEALSSSILNGAVCISALYQMEDRMHFPWLDYDIVGEAVNILQTESINLLDIIAQHVHADSVQQTYRDIMSSRHHGKAIVYDW